MAIPSLLAWAIVICYILYGYRRFRENIEEGELSWFTVWLSYGHTIWDAVDVTLDAFLFYQLELGELLNANITRNSNVNNAILAFAIIGLKMFIWFMLPIKQHEGPKRYFQQMKQIITLYTFTFEDGPELILEYFYIEKYFTKDHLAWYVIAKDFVIGLILLFCFLT